MIFAHISPALQILTLLALPTLSVAYTWNFESTPQQCSNLTISVSGAGGKPPYRVLILPFGPTPLANNVEARKVIDQPFPGDSASVSFKLNYPADSQFVAVVSDAISFGSGGTSIATQVADSPDSSCFNKDSSVSPDFVFSIDPPNQIVQCQGTRLFWIEGTVKGIVPNFLGVIPGGQSFVIPRSTITNETEEGKGLGFTWKASVKGGTTLMIVGGDERGNGTGGSILAAVSNGPNNDTSCLTM